MKKITVALALVTTLAILGGCGSKNQATKESSSSTVTSSTVESTESDSGIKEKEMKVSIFSGTLKEDAKANEDEGKTIRLVLENVKVIEDPENIIGSFGTDGVILNVSKDTFAKGVAGEQLVTGDDVQFTLEGLPIMTMSIPPQIPGNSISLVEKMP